MAAFDAHHAWITATNSTITLADTRRAIESARVELEQRTLAPRADRLTGRQAELLCALAAHGGRARISDIVATLGLASSSQLSRTRDELLNKGEIYAPSRAAIGLTVPLMADYILGSYEELRGQASRNLLPLADIQAAAERIGRRQGR